MSINLDFETRSQVDLLTEGDNYFFDPTTDVVSMRWHDTRRPDVIQMWHAPWHPFHDGSPPPDFSDRIVKAWNARFERLIWNNVMVRYGAKPIPLENFRCTMYKSLANNMPGALGNAARCLGLPQQKMARGKELIKLLSVPLPDGTFHEANDLFEEFDEYCAQDVRTERSVDEQLREPTEEEWQDYFVNERINDRGFRIDVELCEAAQAYAAEEEADLIERIEEVTQGEITKARGEKLKDWVVERLTPEQEKALVVYKKGERKLSLAKYNRFRLLSIADIDPDVREVVECSDFAQKSSVGKFRAMASRADLETNRLSGALRANGAPASGRYSSQGAQIHNFPRDCVDEPEDVRADFIDNIMPEDIVDWLDMPMMTILSQLLRPAIIPDPGNCFLDSDYSSIEGRVGPWIADGYPRAQAKLDDYENDVDVYVRTAAGTFHCAEEDVSKDQRQVGKVQELAFQFGGGAGAFKNMARNYGVVATENEAKRYRDAWRAQNPWAEGIWADCERAAKLAVSHPGREYYAGRLTYFAVEGILAGGTTLFCQLPCERVLTYPDARIEMLPMPWDENDLRPGLTCMRSSWVPKATEKAWPREKLWGGILFQNGVQAVAASLLRWALRKCDKLELPVVFHVHDQIVVETKNAIADSMVLDAVMNAKPDWAEGLPVSADVDIRERFGK